MRGQCTILLGVLLCTVLPAQEIHFSFKHLTTDQGLTSNQINAVAQDSQGYIWIGTAHGLQRYDGIRFRNFRHDPDDARTIPSNMIKTLYFDHRNRLWLMAGEGTVGIFDTHKESFRQIDVFHESRKVERPPEARFLGDARGNIFMLDNKQGLYIWNEQKGHFHTPTLPLPAAKNWRVSGLTQRPGSPDYILSFGTNGLFLLRSGQGVWPGDNPVLEPLLLPGYPQGLEAYNLFVDHNDRLWLQFWPFHTPKIYCYNLARQSPIIRDYEPIVLTGAYIETAPFFQSRDGAMWVYGAGIFARYSESSDTFQLVSNGYVNHRSILYRTINTLFEDRENTIWAGTNDNGLFSFNPGKEYFRNIAHFNRRLNRRGHGSPTGFIQLADSTVLVSVWDDGLYRYDRQWNELPIAYEGDPELKRYSIWSMYPSRRPGIIWMSSQPGRIIRYDQSANRMDAYRAGILEDRTIRQVVEDRRGDLWLGMQSTGLFRWTCDRAGRLAERDVSKFAGIPNCRINKLIMDAKGLLWAATGNYGLYVIDPNTGQVVSHLTDTHTDPDLRLAGPGVSSVLEYNDSLVVISGLSSLQVFNRNRKTLTRIKNETAMAGYIADLALDLSGNVWVSTTSGLYRVNIFNSTILKFGRRDGIDDEHFVLASSRTLSDGRMLFGASETFVVFDPAVFTKIEHDRPEATITALLVNNRLAPMDLPEEAGGLRLRSYESALSIEFSTLQFHRGNSIRYKMDGLDQDWQVNENNLAVYSYLPAGSYRFLLQPVYANGTLGAITSLPISRIPPFWQAWWFYSLVCLAGGGIIFLFDRERLRRKRSVQQMRTRIADHLHAELRMALNSIHILSEMATFKARKDPARAVDYLAQINNKSQQMMHAMDDILWAVAPENDSMPRVVERIEEFVHKLRGGGHAIIDLLVDREVGALVFDMQFRQMLLRLVKESINGMLRAGACSLRVYLGRDKTQLSYMIEFDPAETDTTILNNLLQAREMATLLENMGAAHQLDVHQLKGTLRFYVSP